MSSSSAESSAHGQVSPVVMPIMSVPKAKRAASIDLTFDFPMDTMDHHSNRVDGRWAQNDFESSTNNSSLGHADPLRQFLGNAGNNANLNHSHHHSNTASSIPEKGVFDDLLQGPTPISASVGRGSLGLFGENSRVDDLHSSSNVFNRSHSPLPQNSPFAPSVSRSGVSSLHGTPSLLNSNSGLFEDRPLSGLGDTNNGNMGSNGSSTNHWPFLLDHRSIQQPRATSSLGFAMSSHGAHNSLIANSITRPVSTPIYSTYSQSNSGLGGLGQLGGQMDDMFAGLGGSQQQQQRRLGQSPGLPAMDTLLQGLNLRNGSVATSRGLPQLNQDSLGSHHQHLQKNNMQQQQQNEHNAGWSRPSRFNMNPNAPLLNFNHGLVGDHQQQQHQKQQNSHNLNLSNSGRIASPAPVGLMNPHMNTPNQHLLHRRSNNNTPSNGSHNHAQHHNNSRHHHNPHSNSTMSPKIPIQNMDDRSIEAVVATNCGHILVDAADHSLKAVELANTLRARVGTEVMAIVRDRWGGLLTLLERHADRFLVERIPKNDRVSLLLGNDGLPISREKSDTTAAATTTTSPDNDSASGEEGHDSPFTDDALRATRSRPTTTDPDASGDVFHRESSIKQQGHMVRTSMSASPSPAVNTHHNGEENQQATRCLHVGNVPASYTEVQLMNDFEKFGQIEGLKLISHKNGNRRFAFITFRTISQAITARHCLSKVHPWKSAISFAHREPGGNNGNQGHNNNFQRGHGHGHGNGTPNSSNGHNHALLAGLIGRTPSPQLGGLGLLPPLQLFSAEESAGLCNDLNVNATTAPPAVPTYSSIVTGGSTANAATTAIAVDLTMTTTTTTTEEISSLDISSNSLLEGSTPAAAAGAAAAPPQSTRNHIHVHIPSTPREIAVMQRLCDDTYVPTQPWIVDTEADMPFCRAVTDQISLFGGSTTISKLRGFLKHRVGTVDNIKSVPLKAMLMAYPHLFKVDGNFVMLVSSSNSSSHN